MPTRVRRSERPPLDMGNLPRALSPLEAAQVLNISDGSYYRYIHPAVVRGEIKSLTIGRQRRILTDSLLEWMEAQAQKEAWR
jgi:excisionase family DNA binding protein